MADQGLDKGVFAGLLGQSSGGNINTGAAGISAEGQNASGPPRQHLFDALLQDRQPANPFDALLNGVVSTTPEASTRESTNTRSEIRNERARNDSGNSDPDLDGHPDSREGIVRQAKEFTREIHSLTGLHSLETQRTFRALEVLSLTPMGRMELRRRI